MESRTAGLDGGYQNLEEQVPSPALGKDMHVPIREHLSIPAQCCGQDEKKSGFLCFL